MAKPKVHKDEETGFWEVVSGLGECRHYTWREAIWCAMLEMKVYG